MSLTALRKEFDGLQEKFKAMIQAAFTEAVGEFWNEFPEAKVVSWNQYTPYFNDGEPCEFSVNEWSVRVNDVDEYGYSEDEEEENLPVVKGACEAFSKLLRAAGDDVLLAVYGDHSKITLKRGGKVEVDSYEHD